MEYDICKVCGKPIKDYELRYNNYYPVHSWCVKDGEYDLHFSKGNFKLSAKTYLMPKKKVAKLIHTCSKIANEVNT